MNINCAECESAYYVFDETFKPTKCALCGSNGIKVSPKDCELCNGEGTIEMDEGSDYVHFQSVTCECVK